MPLLMIYSIQMSKLDTSEKSHIGEGLISRPANTALP
jgi:hypothetical protein